MARDKDCKPPIVETEAVKKFLADKDYNIKFSSRNYARIGINTREDYILEEDLSDELTDDLVVTQRKKRASLLTVGIFRD